MDIGEQERVIIVEPLETPEEPRRPAPRRQPAVPQPAEKDAAPIERETEPAEI
ncbi:MAG TPA: hypothetical protein VIY70_02885 [Acidimicrobiia bacterium]